MTHRGRFVPYFILLPISGLTFIFILLPAILSLQFSFQSYNLIRPNEIRFVGMANFIRVFQDPELTQTIVNSGFILVTMITLTFVGSIAIALLLNRNLPGRRFLLATLILPWALPQVVNAVVWQNIISPLYGALNSILFQLNLIERYVVWTRNSSTTLFIIVLVLLWKTLPITSIIVLAAMQSIPNELYDAARVDGANAVQRFMYITFPGISFSTAIILSIASINALNVFDEIYILARFRGDTRSLAMEAYMQAFRFLDLGFGAAIAYLLLLAGALFSTVYLKNLYREIQR